MNDNVLRYKGYTAAIEYSVEDKVLHGKIDGIDDLVSFCSEDALEIETEFHAAVDGYLDFCKEMGKEPNKVYSGTFNVRIKPELHKQLSITAIHNHRSLNAEVENAIDVYLNQSFPHTQPPISINIQAETNQSYGDFWNEGGNSYGINFQRASQLVDSFN